MGLWTTPFQEAVDAATSEHILNGQENIEANLQVVDYIKGKQIPSKEALKYIRKKCSHKNPNVQILALKLIDACVKNCGQHFLLEMASRDFVIFLKNSIRTDLTLNAEVRYKMIEYLQIWGLMFKSRPELGFMTDAYEELKREGLQFPPAPKIDALILETRTAPEWSDSDTCSRCRVSFSITTRKHHCRNCGKTFCNNCSTQSLPLPEFGINNPVRVCDGCYSTRVAKLREGITRYGEGNRASTVTDKDLELAIRLSLEEAGGNPKTPTVVEDDDPMLAAAIAASIEEEKKKNESKKQNEYSRPQVQLYSRESISIRSPSPIEQQKKTNELQQQQKKANELISTTEKENIRLFHQLITKMNQNGESVFTNQQIQRLHADLSLLSQKIITAQKDQSLKKTELERALRSVSEAIKRHDAIIEERVRRMGQMGTNPTYQQQQQQQPAQRSFPVPQHPQPQLVQNQFYQPQPFYHPSPVSGPVQGSGYPVTMPQIVPMYHGQMPHSGIPVPTVPIVAPPMAIQTVPLPQQPVEAPQPQIQQPKQQPEEEKPLIEF